VQGVLKGYKSVRNIRQGRAWERPCQRLWKSRDHLRVIWGTELSIHLDCSSSKGEPLGDHPAWAGRKGRTVEATGWVRGARFRPGLLGEEWSPRILAEIKLQLAWAQVSW